MVQDGVGVERKGIQDGGHNHSNDGLKGSSNAYSSHLDLRSVSSTSLPNALGINADIGNLLLRWSRDEELLGEILEILSATLKKFPFSKVERCTTTPPYIHPRYTLSRS